MDDKVEAMFNEIGDGRIVKMEVDCSDKVDKTLPQAEKLAKDKNLPKALELLYSVEKESRLAADMRSNARIQLAIIEICYEQKNYEALFENITTLTKKRSLIKQAVTKMVQKCCTYVDLMPNDELKLKLIQVIRTVTEGKIYLEVERAKLTYKLSKMNEAEGNIADAASVLMELQIETFGSMDKHEKVEILLEQMRLCLARKDYVRAQIISRKISIKYFDDPALQVQNMKLKFYQQMILLDQSESNYLAICRHYLAISQIGSVMNFDEKLHEALRNVVLYVILAPYSNEQSDLIHRVHQNKSLEKLPEYKELLSLFIQQELIFWKNDILQQYEPLLRVGTKTSPATDVFNPNNELGVKQWENLQNRVGEHNIRMIAKYYSRITMKRLSELLDWSLEKTETFLCQMIIDRTVEHAKIDRLDGVVCFEPIKSHVDMMDEWSYSVDHVMNKINQVCHLMAKEEMVHKHVHGGQMINGK